MPVQTRGTDAIPLASRPHLGQYRKLAKDLLRAARDAHPTAIREWAEGWMTRLAKLEPSVGSRDAVDDIIRDVQQTRLVSSREDAGSSLAEAQMLIARLHGFERWPTFARHIEARRSDGSAISQFERAADAIVDGELETLENLLRENHRLIRARSTRDHRATLLHYIAANGHEGFRQRTAPNAEAIARLLLQSGAEVDAQALMYGHSVTTMQMLVSSSPPHEAAKQVALVEILLEFGASPDGIEDDGSPIMTPELPVEDVERAQQHHRDALGLRSGGATREEISVPFRETTSPSSCEEESDRSNLPFTGSLRRDIDASTRNCPCWALRSLSLSSASPEACVSSP